MFNLYSPNIQILLDLLDGEKYDETWYSCGIEGSRFQCPVFPKHARGTKRGGTEDVLSMIPESGIDLDLIG